MQSGIYAIVNTVNGRRYIGSSSDMPARVAAKVGSKHSPEAREKMRVSQQRRRKLEGQVV